MPLTALAPTTALVVIDLQEGLADLPTVTPVRDIAVRAGDLASAFRERALPVVLVNVDGGGTLDFLPALGQHDSDHVVTKNQRSAFHDGTGLADLLATLGATELVVCGVVTGSGVESTVRDAHRLGFDLVIASDAITDRTPEAHDTSLTQVLSTLARVGTVAEVVAALPAR